MAETILATPETTTQVTSQSTGSVNTNTEATVAPETAVKVETPKEDLVSRVSKVKVEAKKEETNPFNLTKEDYDKVQVDPVLSKFYKSMLSDYTRKTQNLSEKEKEIEKIRLQSSTWTAERLQQEVNKPDFIQAAKTVASLQNPPDSGLTDQEYSALTDKEKAQLSNLNQQMQQIQMQNWQMQQRQQDEVLKTRYANYAPDIVDTTIKRLERGEVKADREVVWKALDYDDAVRRAYELGKQDRNLETQEKVNMISPEGFAATPKSEVPPINQGESNSAYFKRLALRRLAEAKGNNTR